MNMFPFETELYDHIVSSNRESITEKEHDELDMLAEEEDERTQEDLWHDIWQAVRTARAYGMSEREIMRAFNED